MNNSKIGLLAIATVATILWCSVPNAAPHKCTHSVTPKGRVVKGAASYHEKTLRMVTAAHGVHRGARLQVKRPDQSWAGAITVTVNDAGPFVSGRVLDLSIGAFARLYSIKRGHGPIEYRVVRDGKGQWTGALRK